MTQSILQKFFDEFDRGRDPDIPPRLNGITNYLFNLGKTSNVVLQRAPIIDNPLNGFGFFEIDEMYRNNEDIYILAKKVVFSLVNRVRLEKERNPFVLFDASAIRDFLELMLISFGKVVKKYFDLICKVFFCFVIIFRKNFYLSSYRLIKILEFSSKAFLVISATSIV